MTKDQAAQITPGTVIIETEYGLLGRFVRVGDSGCEVEVDHDYDGGGFDFWPRASCRPATPAEIAGDVVAKVPPLPPQVPNPIIKTTALRQFPSWIVREYRDGSFDARCPQGGLTRSVPTFHEAVAEVRRIEGL